LSPSSTTSTTSAASSTTSTTSTASPSNTNTMLSSLSLSPSPTTSTASPSNTDTIDQSFVSRVISGDGIIRTLSPITGIKKTPLVSLTDACRSLETLIEDLNINLTAALDFADNFLMDKKDPYGLTREEIGAINLFSQDCLYGILNERLRLADRQQVQPFFPYLKLFLTALNKLPKKECTVWRGVKLDLSTEYKSAKKLTWWSFSSCTLKMSMLTNRIFLGDEGKRTLFSTYTKLGVEIQNYSMYPTEAEILLPPGLRLEVIDILPQKDLQIIQLKELEGLSVV